MPWLRAASGMPAQRVYQGWTRSLRSRVFGAPPTVDCVCTPTTPGTRTAPCGCSAARTGWRRSKRPFAAGLGRSSRTPWPWPARSATPFALNGSPPNLPELPAQAIDTLRGKRSAELDISQPAGRARLEQLLAEADVLVQGYRPGALDRYGLAPGALAERHPHLSVVTLSAWGTTGPWAARRGFDSLVQCPTGIALAEGADGKPGAMPAQATCLVMPLLSSAMVLVSTAITYPHPRHTRRSASRQSDQLGSPWPNFLPYSSQT